MKQQVQLNIYSKNIRCYKLYHVSGTAITSLEHFHFHYLWKSTQYKKSFYTVQIFVVHQLQ